jgi:large subunit ribosomal protein L7/L12
MSEVTQQAVVDYIKGCSRLDLSELIATLESELGVKARRDVPVLHVVDAPPVPIEEQTEFAVWLTGFAADKKINVIKAVREASVGLGIKEAKELVERFPIALKEGIPKAEAEALCAKLVEAGGTANVR